MKYFFILFFILGFSLITLNSCYHDVESELYPQGDCDTTNVTFSNTIQPIFQNYSCLSCHTGTGASGGGVVLDNYNAVKIVAQSGRLYGAVSHSPGYQPMPQGGNKLTSCDISKIKSWVSAGIQNN